MRDTLVVIVFVLLLRVPFLYQAIQGDDVNYLAAAQYAQIDPAHPQHVGLVFQGAKVTMQGHPHPPFNAWFLAALLAITGDIDEITYHSAYIVFSIIIAVAALSLARRFTTRPLLAALLFLVTPAFIVNGTSLESDIPFLAFWLASVALFVKAVDAASLGWLAAAVAAMLFAAMTAFQSLVLVPVLAFYAWQQRPQWRPAWIALLTVPAVLGGWQLFEKLTSEALPAQVLAGYFKTYGLQTPTRKLLNAAALTVHLGWLVAPFLTLNGWIWIVGVIIASALVDWSILFSIPFIAGICVLILCIRQRKDFLAAWVLIFFASALVLFFAGSARYLLPLALPVALLVASRKSPRWLIAGIAFQLLLGLGLAIANYDHWDGYRRGIERFSKDWDKKRIWVNGELGLRHYAESAGAVPVLLGQALRPGDIVVTSKLAFPVSVNTGGGALVPVAEVPITSRLPLRIIGLDSKSAYSVVSTGFRAFDFQTTPIDVLRVETVVERKPTLSFLPMIAPEAAQQIVSGVDRVEDGRQRWMFHRALILLKKPAAAAPLQIELYIPDQAPARRMSVSVDGTPVADNTFPGPGLHKLVTSPVTVRGESATVAIEVDRTFQSPGDQRELGVILVSVGFR